MIVAEQLPLPIEGLARRLTVAMARGEQVVYQCAWCGTVVVVSSSAQVTNLRGKACPACDQVDHGWWREYVGPGHELAGFHLEGGTDG